MGARVIPGHQPMKREHGGVGIGIVRLVALEASGHGRVQDAPQFEREARVRRLLQRRPPESDVPVRIAREHAREPLPDVILGDRHLRREHVLQAPRVEAQPEHRRATHQRAVPRFERVDPRHRRGTDAVGKCVPAAARGRGEEVEQELGMPMRPLDCEPDDVRRQLSHFRSGVGKQLSLLR